MMSALVFVLSCHNGVRPQGSSWLGPMIVAVLYEQTGSIRTAFIYLVSINDLSYQCLLSPNVVYDLAGRSAHHPDPNAIILY